MDTAKVVIKQVFTPREISIIKRFQNHKPCDPPILHRVINKHCSLCNGNVSQVEHNICLQCIAKLMTNNSFLD